MLARLLALLCWYFIALLLLVGVAGFVSFLCAFLQSFRETVRRMRESEPLEVEELDPERN